MGLGTMHSTLTLTTDPQQPDSLLLSQDKSDDQHAESSTKTEVQNDKQQQEDTSVYPKTCLVVINDPRTLFSFCMKMATSDLQHHAYRRPPISF
jgi:hypothetical protein